jgi:peptidoglycan DL-endopeptidase CwlO
MTPPPGTQGPAAAQTALGLLGVPNPADSPDGLNDLQLVQTVYQDQGVSLPGTLTGLATAGTPQAPQGLRAGDAVFFADASGTIDHVGIYLGGGEFIHAPGPGQRVRIASLYDNPWRTSYATARRY